MKNKFYLIAILLISLISNQQLFAQTNAAPDGIIFQAVATDPQGNPAAGRTIYIKDAILQSTVNGQTVYSESFKVTASNTGVFTIVIGKGQKISGPNSITNLDWTAGPYFLNIKAAVAPSLPLADWNADQEYIDMGTSQFWSVPFALYASNVAGFDLKLNIADTTNMLKQYLRKSDTASLSTRIDANKIAVTQEASRAIAGEALKANTTDVTTGLGLKENISNKSTITTLGTSDVLYPTQNAVKKYVDATVGGATPDADATTKGKIQLAGDLSGTAASPTVPGLALKANSTDVTTSLALKADASALATTNATVSSNKTATDAAIASTNTTVSSNNAATQTALNLKANIASPTFTGTVSGIDKTMVGLGNVDNTTDVSKPVSTATQTALNLKEVLANKSTVTTLGTSDLLYPSQKAVKTYVDATVSAATPDADATTKGKIQLAGDLGGTAVLPTVPGLLLKANTTDVTASLALKADASALATTNTTVSSNKTATDAAIATTNSNVTSLNTTVSSNKTATDASIATTNTTVASNNTATQTALNLKANIASPTFTGTVGGIDKTMVGLGNVDNTTDVSKPVSTATQTALNLKEVLANKSTATTLGTSDILYPSQNAVKTYVDATVSAATPDADAATKGKIQLAGDLSGTAASPTVPGLSLKANTTDVTASLALKADASALATTNTTVASNKTATDASIATTNTTVASNNTATQTALNLKANIASPTFTGTVSGIDKTMVGLGNVDNTSDVNKPVSAATLTALNLKEVVANKSTATTLGTSDILYPSQKAVKTYVDATVSAAAPDADATTKGKIQLAGDLSGTAASPVISDNAITTLKILDANVTDAKIATVSGSKVSGNISGNAANVNGIVSIAKGGTGTSTKAGAFDALSPFTTSGDILYGAASGTGTRLGIGSDGQILTLASGLPTWASNSGVPYTGATASVDLGAHDLKVNGLTIGLGNGQNSENTAIGGNALGQSNSSGTRNTAIGSGAMLQYVGTSFDNNTSVGYNNLIGLTTGAANTSVGGETMFNVGSASFNTAIGNHTLMNTTNNQNTALGSDAGNTVSSGSQNTLLGANADVSTGTLTNATAIGTSAIVTASNTIQLGNTSVTNVNTSGTINAAAANFAAGSTSNAPIKLTAGTNLSTPVSGALEYDGTNLYYTNSGAIRQTIATSTSAASASGSTNYISKFTGTSALGSSLLYDNGTNVAIGTTSPSAKFQIGEDGGSSAENYKWGVMNGYNTLQLGYRQTGWKFKTDNSSGVVNNLIFSKTDGTTDNDYMTIGNGGGITMAAGLNVTTTLSAADAAFTNLSLGGGNVSYNNTTGFFGIKSGGPTSLFQVGGNSNSSYSLKFDDGVAPLGGGTISLSYRSQAWKLNTQQNSGNITDLAFLLNDGISDHELMRLNTSGTLTLGAITLPKIDGTSGQVLSTNGSGVVGWTNNGPSGNQTANFVYAAPDGSTGTPLFRALTANDIPSLSNTYLPLSAGSTRPLTDVLYMPETASNDFNQGISWSQGAPTSYGIYRTSGAWTAPNFAQLEMSFATGIVIDGGSGYAKSGTSIQPNGGPTIFGGVASFGSTVNLMAGSTSNAPIKLTAGTNLTTPVSGAIEYDGTNLYYTNSSNNRKTLSTAAAGVPYTGATGSVDLGAYNLNAQGVTIGMGGGSISSNTAIGNSALTSNGGGNSNTAIGNGALSNNTDGYYNTSTGYQSLYYNITGTDNTAYGMRSMWNGNGSGSYNTASGVSSLYQNSGSFNTATGWATLYANNSGAYNTASGSHSLNHNTDGSYNAAYGESSLNANTTGIGNTTIGASSLQTNTTGNFNTVIGYGADVASNNLTNATAIGYGATVSANNTIRLGNSSVTTIGGQVSWTAASDIRLKKNISNSKYGLSTVMQLRPVDYNLISNDLRQVGFIAQEVKKLVPEVVTGKEGDLSKGEILGITYANLVPVLTKAIQEQQTEIIAQQKKIDELKEMVEKLINQKH